MPPGQASRRRAGRHGQIELPETDEAVIQLWAARTSGIRGAIAVHCWLVLKPAGRDTPFERWDVVGRRARTGRIGLQRNVRSPREGWAGHRARCLRDLRGGAAAAALPAVRAAIAGYPYAQRYRSWPGPNCNSFVAHLARTVPALRTALPPLAMGKDYVVGAAVARAPSGTGWQLSVGGLVGCLAAAEEGFELNLLGLVFGWRPGPLRLVMPGLGLLRLGGRSGLNRSFSPLR